MAEGDCSINDYKPTCPVILFEKDYESTSKRLHTMQCERLDVFVECVISTAIIRMEGKWTNRTRDTLDCVFALPTPGTVTHMNIHIGVDRVLTTAIVSKDDAHKMLKQASSTGSSKGNLSEKYEPNIFRLPFGNVAPGDTILVKCEYIEPLDYHKKGYIVSLPLYFPAGTIVVEPEWDQVVHVECKIPTMTSNTKASCATHHVKYKCVNEIGIIQSGACKVSEEEKKQDAYLNISETGRDFVLGYKDRTERITAYCLQETDINDPNSGSLCVYISPPTKMKLSFGRAFFFLIDRSASMIGKPFAEVIRAISSALDRLRASADQFNVCLFDHRQVYYQPSLVPATKEMIANCKKWMTRHLPERGPGGDLFNIEEPIDKALEQLEKSDLLPFCVLITDGTVQNEREICEKIEKIKRMRTRFLCFGVGEYCNRYFLKMLSKLGRGFCDIVRDAEKVYDKLDHLLGIVDAPVLTDIEVGLKGDEIETYPFPIPDLFFHEPVVIAARYLSTELPKKIVIRGFNPHGDQERITCKVQKRNDLPVEIIFIKQTIDLMTADAWLKKSKKLENKVVDVSIHTNVPSLYTNMVTFETTESLLEEEEKKIDKLLQADLDQDNQNRTNKMMAIIRNNKKAVKELAWNDEISGIIVTDNMPFGDVCATMDNVAVFVGGNEDSDDDNCDCDCTLM